PLPPNPKRSFALPDSSSEEEQERQGRSPSSSPSVIVSSHREEEEEEKREDSSLLMEGKELNVESSSELHHVVNHTQLTSGTLHSAARTSSRDHIMKDSLSFLSRTAGKEAQTPHTPGTGTIPVGDKEKSPSSHHRDSLQSESEKKVLESTNNTISLNEEEEREEDKKREEERKREEELQREIEASLEDIEEVKEKSDDIPSIIQNRKDEPPYVDSEYSSSDVGKDDSIHSHSSSSIVGHFSPDPAPRPLLSATKKISTIEDTTEKEAEISSIVDTPHSRSHSASISHRSMSEEEKPEERSQKEAGSSVVDDKSSVVDDKSSVIDDKSSVIDDKSSVIDDFKSSAAGDDISLGVGASGSVEKLDTSSLMKNVDDESEEEDSEIKFELTN
ncbi:hypothetical protein ADUPG1_000242, partial [Aduncisulcus paluster]